MIAASAHEAHSGRGAFLGDQRKKGPDDVNSTECFPDLGTIPGQSSGWPQPYRSSSGTCSQNGEYGGNICFTFWLLLSGLFVIQAHHLELYTIESCGCLGLFS